MTMYSFIYISLSIIKKIIFKDVQLQQQQQKGNLTVHHTLTKILMKMEINHLLKLNILELSVLLHQ